MGAFRAWFDDGSLSKSIYKDQPSCNHTHQMKILVKIHVCALIYSSLPHLALGSHCSCLSSRCIKNTVLSKGFFFSLFPEFATFSLSATFRQLTDTMSEGNLSQAFGIPNKIFLSKEGKGRPHHHSERCWYPHGALAPGRLESWPRSCRSPSLWISHPRSLSCWCRAPCRGHCATRSGYLSCRQALRSCTRCSWPCPVGWRRHDRTAWGPGPFGFSRCPCLSPALSGRSSCPSLCSEVVGAKRREEVKWLV